MTLPPPVIATQSSDLALARTFISSFIQRLQRDLTVLLPDTRFVMTADAERTIAILIKLTGMLMKVTELEHKINNSTTRATRIAAVKPSAKNVPEVKEEVKAAPLDPIADDLECDTPNNTGAVDMPATERKTATDLLQLFRNEVKNSGRKPFQEQKKLSRRHHRR